MDFYGGLLLLLGKPFHLLSIISIGLSLLHNKSGIYFVRLNYNFFRSINTTSTCLCVVDYVTLIVPGIMCSL